MRKPINWINLLCWIAYGILFCMLGIGGVGYAINHGWKTTLALPLLFFFSIWLLRKPLLIAAIWLGLRA